MPHSVFQTPLIIIFSEYCEVQDAMRLFIFLLNTENAVYAPNAVIQGALLRYISILMNYAQNANILECISKDAPNLCLDCRFYVDSFNPSIGLLANTEISDLDNSCFGCWFKKNKDKYMTLEQIESGVCDNTVLMIYHNIGGEDLNYSGGTLFDRSLICDIKQMVLSKQTSCTLQTHMLDKIA